MNEHTERPTRLAGGKTYCSCGQPWPCPMASPGDGLTATLARWAKAEQQATKGPWTVTQRHGVDIADEAWSEVKIIAPDGTDIAATFISHVLENYHDGDDTDFIVTARTAMPALLAALRAVLELADGWEQEAIRLDKRVETHRSPEARQGLSVRAQAHEDCARELRAAITRALTGQEEGNER